jgi:hypothetical protein
MCKEKKDVHTIEHVVGVPLSSAFVCSGGGGGGEGGLSNPPPSASHTHTRP